MERLSRWSESDRQMFRKANAYLRDKAPEILEDVGNFNQTNKSGLVTGFEMHSPKTHWGYLSGCIPTPSGLRVLNMDATLEMLDFSSYLEEKFELRIRRISSKDESDVRLEYSVNPDFQKFRENPPIFYL